MMGFLDNRHKHFFIFLIVATIGSIFAFISMGLSIKSYVPHPSNYLSVKHERRRNSFQDSHGSASDHNIGTNIENDDEFSIEEFSIVAALFSGHSNWASSGCRIYRTVTCPEINGTMTISNAMGNVTATKEADVVMFSRGGVDPKKWQQLLSIRREEQIWLHTGEESIYHAPPVPGSPQVIIPNLRFNVTYGYHLESDIFQGFGEVVERRQGEHGNTAKTIDLKPSNVSPVAWMSSRDYQYWNRSGFVRNLSKHLSIDAFGELGVMTLSRKGNESTTTLKRYKFYLSLENSCCSHYITEKFWVAMASYEAVPIVVGPSKFDYERVAPPNSFIYANDFESMESLANYVNKVSSDPELYDKFHQWRKTFDIYTYMPSDMFPFMKDDRVCLTLKVLRDHAWREDSPLRGMDPYGKTWLRSCTSCGKHDWLRTFDLNGKHYLRDLERYAEANITAI